MIIIKLEVSSSSSSTEQNDQCLNKNKENSLEFSIVYKLILASFLLNKDPNKTNWKVFSPVCNFGCCADFLCEMIFVWQMDSN